MQRRRFRNCPGPTAATASNAPLRACRWITTNHTAKARQRPRQSHRPSVLPSGRHRTQRGSDPRVPAVRLRSVPALRLHRLRPARHGPEQPGGRLLRPASGLHRALPHAAIDPRARVPGGRAALCPPLRTSQSRHPAAPEFSECRPRPRPAARGGRRRQAQLLRRLVRHHRGRDVRLAVPGSRPRAPARQRDGCRRLPAPSDPRLARVRRIARGGAAALPASRPAAASATATRNAHSTACWRVSNANRCLPPILQCPEG